MAINKKKLTNYVVITLLLTVGLIGATRLYFSIAVKNIYTKDQVIANMQSHVFPVPRKVHKTTEGGPQTIGSQQADLASAYGNPAFCEWAIIPIICRLAISAKPVS